MAYITIVHGQKNAIFAYNQIAGIYFDGLKDYQKTVDTYRELAEKYPNTKEAKQSLFMVAFTYDATAKVGTVYRDGAQFDQKTNETIKFENPSQVVVGGYQEAAGVVDNYGNNTWMAGFPGKMDNVRLYGKALSSAEVLALFTNKQ